MNELHERKQVADEKINEIKQHKQELDAKLQQDKQIAEDKIAEIKEHKNK